MSRDSNKKPGIFGRTLGAVKDAGGKVRDAGASALRDIASRIEGPKASFDLAGPPIEFQFDVGAETIWATQQQIADLFGVERSVITKHIQNVLSENELEDGPATCAKIAHVRFEGSREVTREVEHYSLDMILAVGYRVSGKKATQFRQWATSKLGAYLRDGYILNERRLRDDPEALQSLAEKVRALRSEEKHVFARVRDAFVLTASDYDPQSDEARHFFMSLQEKFTYAAAECTSAELILARADGTKDLMGMSSFLGAKLTKKDTTVGKNYLLERELKYLHLVSEAFLVFLEGKAMKGKKITMAELAAKMDKILEFNEMPVFPGYTQGYLRNKADAYAHKQYELFKSRTAQTKYDQSRGISPR